jgi:outer membrane protein TolC
MIITKYKKQSSLIRLRIVAIVVVGLVFPLSSAHSDTLTLDLKQATRMALENNHELAAASYKVDEANSGVKIARTNFLPKLNAQARYTRLDEEPYLDASGFGRLFEPLMAPFEDLVANGYLDPSTLSGLSGAGGPGKIIVGDDDNYSMNLSLEQPLFTGFALTNNLKIAKYQRVNSELSLQRSRENIWLRTTLAYWGLVRAKEFVKVTEESIAQLESHVEDLRNLLQAGIIIENDLLRAELALSNAQLQNVRAANGVRLANTALCNVLAIDQSTVIEPTEITIINETALLPLNDLSRQAIGSRPDYIAFGNNIRILDRVKAIRKAEYLPKLALVANYDWKRPNREYEPEFYGSWNINLVATLSVFNWGQRHHEIQKVEAQKRQLTELHEQLADYVRFEVRQAYQLVEESRQAVKIAEQAVAQAEENFRVTSTNYEAGVLTNSDLLDAQTGLTQAKIALVQAKTQQMSAVASLQAATSDIEER